MKYRAIQIGEKLYANYWVYPALLSIAALVVSITLTDIDKYIHPKWFTELRIFTNIGSVGIRNILSLIATASITITSVTFSITVLTLALVSQQLGPRLIPIFMRQGRTQLVLGIFIGTFVYCLISLRAIPENIALNQPPYITLAVALALGVSIFFVLIYFIHYVCHAIQINSILDYLTSDAINSLTRQFHSRDPNQFSFTNYTLPEKIILETHQEKLVIKSQADGYIQTIDESELVNIAIDADLVIQSLQRPGHYVFKSSPIFIVYSKNKVAKNIAEKIQNQLKAGSIRSTVQDPEYAIQQINEVAVRAMSTGINDPYTAINCLDRYSSLFAKINELELNPDIVFDKKQQARLIRNSFSYTGFVNTALDRFRQQAKTDTAVSIRILEVIAKLCKQDLVVELKEALVKQAELVVSDYKDKNTNQSDLNEVLKIFNEITSS